ncbi:MAG: alpha/beta hydrolase [Gammaproteobacteria bacterium]|nr:alpha/beta hydrolase [Gammaproteobacteria bacterium]
MNTDISNHVLFVHDAGGGSWEWCVWNEIFEQYNFHNHAINLQPSALGLQNTTSEDYIQQLIAYSTNLGLSSPILVGAGMGGMLALRVYEQLKPSAMILVNPLGSEALGRPLEEIDFNSIIFNNHQYWTENDLNVPMDDKEKHTGRESRQESGPALQNLLEKTPIPDIDCPCLLLIGEHRQVIPPETGNELAARLNAEVISFEGSNHIGALLGIEAKAIARQVCQNLLSR